MRWLALATALIVLGGCHGNGKPGSDDKAVEKKVEKEVARRVEAKEAELKTRQSDQRTYRTIGFIVLAVGATGTLVVLQRQRPPARAPALEYPLTRPVWNDHFVVPDRRVIEIDPATPAPRPLPPPPGPPARRRRRVSRGRKRHKPYPPP